MKIDHRPEDKLEYFSYILCYVDDILCIYHDPDNVLNQTERVHAIETWISQEL